MNAKLLKIVPAYSREDMVADAKTLLEDCKTEEFSSVIVLGFKNQTVRILQSKQYNTLELLGALDMAKQEILRDE
jgi:hypothetical protein